MAGSRLIPVLIAALAVAVLAAANVFVSRKAAAPVAPQKTDSAQSPCKPAFADGGGPYYLPDAPFRTNIAPPDTKGEKLVVSGKILRNDCTTPAGNAVLDIWQADETGTYVDDWYRGRITAAADGSYLFETAIPKGYGEGTGYRPPHIHFKVFENAKEIITSQMFFPEISGTPGFDEAYIMKTETATEDGRRVTRGSHDIVLP